MRLTILGASGHGKVVADIAQLNGYNDIQFLDDDPSVTSCGVYPVVGKTSDAAHVEGDLFVAVGNATIRKRLMDQFADKHYPVLVHPNSTVASSSYIGSGTVVVAGAVVNPYAKIGRGCIVNTCASIDHDCIVEDFVHVSVGAHVCGTVTIGEGTWIGAGSTVSNNLTICSNAIIGAGAVVIGDITAKGIYVGVPVRLSKHRGD